MKIAIFTDAFLPQINGVVTHLTETIKEFVKSNHEILLIAPRPNKDINLGLLDTVKVKYVTGLPATVYPDFYITNPLSYQILKTSQKFGPDIIHFHTPITIGFNAIVVSKYLKKPLVSTFHAYFMEPEYLKVFGFDKIGLDKNKTINEIGWYYARFFYDQSDVIICPSKYTKDDLTKHGFTKTIKIISNGLSLPGKQRKTIDIPENYFLYVGRISKEKNLDLLISSYRDFAALNKKIDLVIVGDGPAKNELENLAIKYDLKGRVHFTGAILHDDLMESNVFLGALAFVNPSTSETQGLSVLEACSFRLPIITVKGRALNELIKDNGILCKPNASELTRALEVISKDKNLRERYSINSLKIAKNHSIKNTVRQLEKIYSSLTKK